MKLHSRVELPFVNEKYTKSTESALKDWIRTIATGAIGSLDLDSPLTMEDIERVKYYTNLLVQLGEADE